MRARAARWLTAQVRTLEQPGAAAEAAAEEAAGRLSVRPWAVATVVVALSALAFVLASRRHRRNIGSSDQVLPERIWPRLSRRSLRQSGMPAARISVDFLGGLEAIEHLRALAPAPSPRERGRRRVWGFPPDAQRPSGPGVDPSSTNVPRLRGAPPPPPRSHRPSSTRARGSRPRSPTATVLVQACGSRAASSRQQHRLVSSGSGRSGSVPLACARARCGLLQSLERRAHPARPECRTADEQHPEGFDRALAARPGRHGSRVGGLADLPLLDPAAPPAAAGSASSISVLAPNRSSPRRHVARCRAPLGRPNTTRPAPAPARPSACTRAEWISRPNATAVAATFAASVGGRGRGGREGLDEQRVGFRVAVSGAVGRHGRASRMIVIASACPRE